MTLARGPWRTPDALKRALPTFFLATRAGAAWERALVLIEERKPSGYAEAVELLTKLHELAIHEGTATLFAQDVQKLRAKYPKRPALQRRLDEAGLP